MLFELSNYLFLTLHCRRASYLSPYHPFSPSQCSLACCLILSWRRKFQSAVLAKRGDSTEKRESTTPSPLWSPTQNFGAHHWQSVLLPRAAKITNSCGCSTPPPRDVRRPSGFKTSCFLELHSFLIIPDVSGHLKALFLSGACLWDVFADIPWKGIIKWILFFTPQQADTTERVLNLSQQQVLSVTETFAERVRDSALQYHCHQEWRSCALGE